MNINDLSNTLGVSTNTIRSWENQYKLEVPRTNRNYRKYDDDVVKIFETIKELKDEDRGHSTIKKVISSNLLEPEVNKNVTNNLDSTDNNNSKFQELKSNLQEVIVTNNLELRKELVHNMQEVISTNNELSEKYAKATYKIGELETTNKFLLKENEKLEQNMKLLPDPIAYAKINSEKNEVLSKLDKVNDENKRLQEQIQLMKLHDLSEIEDLKMHLEELAKENNELKQPWWKKIFQK